MKPDAWKTKNGKYFACAIRQQRDILKHRFSAISQRRNQHQESLNLVWNENSEGDLMSTTMEKHNSSYHIQTISRSILHSYSLYHFMIITLLALLSLCIILPPAIADSSEDDCGYITTWSEDDANLGGSYTTPTRFVCDNEPDRHVMYFGDADHDHTGLLAAYDIPGWGEIDLEVRIASFESHAVALTEFDNWADEHCLERDNYFGKTKRENGSCYVESWQRDRDTGEIIGCNTLWIT
ncbi:MAG: hypothetical protein JRI58_14180, partial [Deltaproteobacteria bacterium]|nr:hypothetical protein [Deltaproteobacteria bacterium]